MVASTAQAARSKGGQFGPEYPGQFARNGVVNLQRNRLSTYPGIRWSISAEYPINILYLLGNIFDIDFRFLFKRINIPRDIQVIIIILYFL